MSFDNYIYSYNHHIKHILDMYCSKDIYKNYVFEVFKK